MSAFIARILLPGVDHVHPPTPGVRLSRFSVTRLTASALPLYEWVSNHGRALTLPCLPSCVAFTIRACSLLTSRRRLCCASVYCGRWEHPRLNFSQSFAFPPEKVFRLSRVERPCGSLPAFAWDNVAEAQPLSGPLQSGIRFLRFPLPTLPTAFLTVGLPQRGSYTGLPCSAQFARDGLGSAYPPVALVSVPPQLEKEGPATFPFWVRPVSVFGLLRIDDVYQQFTCVNHTVQPCAPSASTLADVFPPRRFHMVQRTGLRCPEGFTPNRYQFRMLQ